MSAVLTKTVRSFFNADQKRLDRLSPEARKTVEFDSANRAPKGRLHPDVIKAYNKGRKPERQYVVGATTAANKARTENRAALVAQGLAGTRGPVRKAGVSLSKD